MHEHDVLDVIVCICKPSVEITYLLKLSNYTNILTYYRFFLRPGLNNVERLRTLVQVSSSNLSASVVQSGHLFAMLSAGSHLSAASQLLEQWTGLSQVREPAFAIK